MEQQSFERFFFFNSWENFVSIKYFFFKFIDIILNCKIFKNLIRGKIK